MESSYDVIENLMRNRSPSRMGLRDPIWPQTLAKWVTQGYPVDEAGKPVDPVMHFDQDWVSVGGGFDSLPIRGYREVVEETEDWHIIRNGAGAELKHWKQQAGTPEHIRFAMTNRKVWEDQYRSHLLTLDPKRLNLESTRKNLQIRRKQKKWAMFQSLFLYENMRQSMGDVHMYESFLTDPDWIHDYWRLGVIRFNLQSKRKTNWCSSGDLTSGFWNPATGRPFDRAWSTCWTPCGKNLCDTFSARTTRFRPM